MDDLSNPLDESSNAGSVDSGAVGGVEEPRLSTPMMVSAVITPRGPSSSHRGNSRGGSRGASRTGSRGGSGSPVAKSRQGSPKRPATPSVGGTELSDQSPATPSNAKMNYAPVWKPGFQNRRFQSSYLKKSFPAGFQMKILRSQYSGDHFEHVLHEASKAGTMRIDDSSFSFVNWAKGGSAGGSFDFDDEDDGNKDGDPFADCAGPTLEELQRARRQMKQAPTFDFVANDPACMVRRATISTLDTHQEHQLQRMQHSQSRTQKTIKSSSASTIPAPKANPPKIKVYHAPALMPTLTPVLSNSNSFILNNQAGAIKRVFQKQEFSQQYEQWIQDRRAHIDDKVWKTKGNNADFNYSAHSFNGSPPKYGNSSPKKRVQSTLPPVPRPWRPEMGVEIYTTNQLIKTKNAEDFDKQYVYKIISSDSTLHDLRMNIAHDIVDGIKRAFPDLPSLLNLSSTEEFHKLVPIKLEKIEMSFQYYHPEVSAWRQLTCEAEWIECKNLATYYGGNIQAMYCLSAQSETLLVNQIQKNYELQQTALAKRRPPISIEDLTDALAAETKRKQKRSASEPKLSNSASQPLKLKSLRTPPATPSGQSDPSRTANKVLSQAGHQSVLYPQSSAKLKSLQSQSQASITRLEAFANNLEGRILKTKW